MRDYGIALWQALVRFSERGGFMRSSHVALAMMLALFPFCIFALSLAGQFGRYADVDFLMDFVFGSWPAEVAQPIRSEVLRVLDASGGGSLTFGALLTVFFASNGVEALRTAITDAYREDDPRPWWVTRAQSVGFVIGAAALIIASGVVSVAVPLYLHFFAEAGLGGVIGFLSNDSVRFAVTSFSLILSVLACHKWLPGIQRPIRALLPGIILTLGLWVAGGKGFEIYLSRFASYSVTYAGLAGVMAALVFLYAMAAIFILGAEFNGRLARLRGNEAS